MLFSPKYNVVRKVTAIIWVVGAFIIIPLGVWLPVILDGANAHLDRIGAKAWVAQVHANPDGLARMAGYMTYLERAVAPALLHAALPTLWWFALVQMAWIVLAVAVLYPKFRATYQGMQDHPGAGRWATIQEVLRHFSGKRAEIAWYLGMLRPSRFLDRIALGLAGKREAAVMVPHDLIGMGLLVVGGTGAGKTWGVLIPQILHLSRYPEVSVVAADIKFGERDCLSVASRAWPRDSTVVAWNPWDPHSIRVDVVPSLGLPADAPMEEREEAVRRAHGDIRDQVAIIMGHSPAQVADDVQFWSSNEAVLLDVLLTIAVYEGRGMERVRELSYLMPDRLHHEVISLPMLEVRRRLDRFWALSYDKQAGTMQGLEKYLADWDDDNVKRATTRGAADETFDLQRILREHVLFIIAIPQEKFVSGHALLMFRLIMRMITKMLLAPRTAGETQKVAMILEEFPQLEKIPYFSRFLATCRSRGVATIVTAQGMHQGYAQYGKDEFLGLLNNFRTRVVFFSSLSPEEAVYFSRLMGEGTADRVSWGGSLRSGHRMSVSEAGKALAPHEEMHWKWQPHEAAVHTQGVPDFTAHFPPAPLVPLFRERLGGPEGPLPSPDRRGITPLSPPSMAKLLDRYKRKVGECAFYNFICERTEESAAPVLLVSPSGNGADPPPRAQALLDLADRSDAADVTERPAPAPAAAQGNGETGRVGRPSGAEVIRQLAVAVLEMASVDPESVRGMDVNTGRGKYLKQIIVPRSILEKVFGIGRFVQEMKVWMSFDWMKPRPADRFEFTRSICQMLSPDLAQRLIAIGEEQKGRRAPIGQPHEAHEAKTRGAPGERLRDVCLWVHGHLAYFEGAPQRAAHLESYGTYEEGAWIAVLPHVLHKVMGDGREAQFELWGQWRDNGWTEVTGDKRLTRVCRLKDKGPTRMVAIRWPIYEAALAGKPITVAGQMRLATVSDEAKQLQAVEGRRL